MYVKSCNVMFPLHPRLRLMLRDLIPSSPPWSYSLSCPVLWFLWLLYSKKHAPKQELITEFYNLVPFLQLNFWNTSTSVPLLPSFAKQLGEVATATHEMIVEIGGPARVEGVPRKKWHAQFIELLMASNKTVFSSTLPRERSWIHSVRIGEFGFRVKHPTFPGKL